MSEPIDPGKLTFDDKGLVPAVVQDARTGEVLMLAWQSREALDRTRATGFATFFSRSRQSLWTKGETSGNTQRVRGMATDCDRDAVLLQVDPAGPACHTGARSCFFEELAGCPPLAPPPGQSLSTLEKLLQERRVNPPEGSYTAKLFADDSLRHKKLGEETAELIVASLKRDRAGIVHEAADLVFHLLAALAPHGITLADVANELRAREGKRR